MSSRRRNRCFSEQVLCRELGIRKYRCSSKCNQSVVPRFPKFDRTFRLRDLIVADNDKQEIFLTWTCDGDYLISYRPYMLDNKMCFLSFWSLDLQEKPKLVANSIGFEHAFTSLDHISDFLYDMGEETQYCLWVHQHMHCDFIVTSSIEYDKLDSPENIELKVCVNNIHRNECSSCHPDKNYSRLTKCKKHSYNLTMKMMVVSVANCEQKGFRLYLLPEGGIILNSGIGIHCILWTVLPVGVHKVTDIQYNSKHETSKIYGLNDIRLENGMSIEMTGMAGGYNLTDKQLKESGMKEGGNIGVPCRNELLWSEECFVDLEHIVADVAEQSLRKIGERFDSIEDYESIVGDIDYCASVVHASCMYVVRSDTYSVYEGGFEILVDYRAKCIKLIDTWEHLKKRDERWKLKFELSKAWLFSLESSNPTTICGTVCNNIPVIAGETLASLENPMGNMKIVL